MIIMSKLKLVLMLNHFNILLIRFLNLVLMLKHFNILKIRFLREFLQKRGQWRAIICVCLNSIYNFKVQICLYIISKYRFVYKSLFYLFKLIFFFFKF